jgi:hypothetical protein
MLDGEFDGQQMQPAGALVGQLRGERGDASLCQHDHLAQAIDLVSHVAARGTGPAAKLDRRGDAIEHAIDPGPDRAAQPSQFGLRAVGQQDVAHQCGVGSGEH